MNLFKFFKKLFVDVIEWNENDNGVLAYHYPAPDQEIQNGAQLTVRDTQLALFVNEGQLADVFEPGMYTLTTNTLPLLTNLKNWDKFFKSPFKSDIYFFSTREQIDQRWGTPSAIVIRDQEMGPVRVRAHGTYSYRVKNPNIFFKKISGTKDRYTTQELEGQLRASILTALSVFFGNTTVNFVDMSANQEKFSATLKEALAPTFADYGLKLETFLLQNVSLPDVLQDKMDQAAQMGAADPAAALSKLHDLLGKGVITQADFDVKKAELLKKI